MRGEPCETSYAAAQHRTPSPGCDTSIPGPSDTSAQLGADGLGLPRTDRFDQGSRIEGWLLLGWVLPIHRHHLEVVRVDHGAMTLSSNEWNWVLRRWDHDIVVERREGDRSRYTDRVVIDAGPFTLPVATFAWLFHRYRQSRWRQLARRAPRR